MKENKPPLHEPVLSKTQNNNFEEFFQTTTETETETETEHLSFEFYEKNFIDSNNIEYNSQRLIKTPVSVPEGIREIFDQCKNKHDNLLNIALMLHTPNIEPQKLPIQILLEILNEYFLLDFQYFTKVKFNLLSFYGYFTNNSKRLPVRKVYLIFKSFYVYNQNRLAELPLSNVRAIKFTKFREFLMENDVLHKYISAWKNLKYIRLKTDDPEFLNKLNKQIEHVDLIDTNEKLLIHDKEIQILNTLKNMKSLKVYYFGNYIFKITTKRDLKLKGLVRLHLDYLPSSFSFYFLQNLKYLHLKKSQITSFQISYILNMDNLLDLRFIYCLLDSNVYKVFEMKTLKLIDLSWSTLKTIKDFSKVKFPPLSSIEKINLERIENLPIQFIKNLLHLRKLNYLNINLCLIFENLLNLLLKHENQWENIVIAEIFRLKSQNNKELISKVKQVLDKNKNIKIVKRGNRSRSLGFSFRFHDS